MNPLCYQKLYFNKEINTEEQRKTQIIEEEEKKKETKNEESHSKDSILKQNHRGDTGEIDLNLLLHNYENKDIYNNNKSFFEKQFDNKFELKKQKKEKKIHVFNKENILKTFKDIDDSDSDNLDIKLNVSSFNESPKSNKKKINTKNKEKNKSTKKAKESKEEKETKEEKKEIVKAKEESDDEENFIKEYSALIEKKELERKNLIIKENRGKKKDSFNELLEEND